MHKILFYNKMKDQSSLVERKKKKKKKLKWEHNRYNLGFFRGLQIIYLPTFLTSTKLISFTNEK